MNGSEALVRMLGEYGVDYIFGVPGDTNVALYRALEMADGKPRHIMCRDERSAVFMADCYARLSGKPGVAEVPSGAGAMYGLPGVAEANQSSVPLILLVNDIPHAGVGRGTLTELDIEALFKPISKHTETLARVDKLPEVVRRAFRIATGGRPGAVVLALPEDLLYEDMPQAGISLHIEAQSRAAPSSRPRPSDEEMRPAVEALGQARRPLIVAGGGANRSGAAAAISAMAETLRIPVVTTITGQGVIPDDHELAIGIIGDNGFHPHAIWALGQADLAIYVGCRMGSVATMHWKWPKRGSGARVIQIDLDAEVLSNTYAVDIPLHGDARSVVEALTKLSGPTTDRGGWIDEINARREAFWRRVEPGLKSDASPILPERVIAALNQHLPDRCAVISDAGTPTPYSTRFLRLKQNESRLVIPRFYGGLGYAIPAVVGAYFADPSKRVVGLFGDGSLGMSAGELETIARLGVPAILIHFNNACFGWIKALQRVTRKPPSNSDTFSVDFSSLDMSRLAASYGIRSFRVETAGELDLALAEAMRLQEPVFLDVVVESIGDRLPPVHSWIEKVGADPEAVEFSAGHNFARKSA